MTGPAARWCRAVPADLPAGDDWLQPPERAAVASLAAGRALRHRLGRWAAKRLAADWSGLPPQDLAVVAAGDGAPEVWAGGHRLGVSVSISHRGDQALAVLAPLPWQVGCDLELVEPRSGAFVRTWCTEAEQAWLAGSAGAADHARRANLLWSAKESVTKAHREGLRMAVASIEVRVGQTPAGGPWRPFTAGGLHGWWAGSARTVATVAVLDPASRPGVACGLPLWPLDPGMTPV